MALIYNPHKYKGLTPQERYEAEKKEFMERPLINGMTIEGREALWEAYN